MASELSFTQWNSQIHTDSAAGAVTFNQGGMGVLNPPAGGGFAEGLASGLQTLGPIMAIFGAANSAIGTFYQAKSAQNQLKSQALNQQFQSEMSAINAKSAEFSAQQSMLSSARQIGRYTMGAGQAKSSAKASMAARGIQAGVGSAAEVIGSMDLIKEIDRMTMSANSVRQAESIRNQAMNYRNQSIMSGLSADNLNTTAGTISPGMGVGTSLLTSAADIGQNWARNNRIDQLIAANSSVRS
jgi:hypothetical protein